MASRKQICAAVALSLLGGCAGASQRELEQTRQTLRSWTASLEFAAQQHASGRMPSLFLPQLLKSADEALNREQRKIDNAPPAQRAELQTLAQQLDSKIRAQQARPAAGQGK
jgi:hypothetical protein